MALSTDTLFSAAAKAGASDVHLAGDHPIVFRIDGDLIAQTKKAVSKTDIEHVVKAVVGDERYKRLQEEREVDAGYHMKNGMRLRVNAHYERGQMGMVARLVPAQVPAIEDLELNDIAEMIHSMNEGLILFTGPTGEGKSTSLASLLQFLHTQRSLHTVTLEDPVEFQLDPEKGIVRQRELGSDFLSFADALKHVLRQDPDIIMVGEMRDPETIAAALTLAETGHIVLATLHTPNAIQTVDRIIDVFQPHQQPQIRSQLSMSLKFVVAQQLVPRTEGGRVAIREVLVNNNASANIIREGRIQELKSVLQTSRDRGMRTFETDAKRLLKEGIVEKEAVAHIFA